MTWAKRYDEQCKNTDENSYLAVDQTLTKMKKYLFLLFLGFMAVVAQAQEAPHIPGELIVMLHKGETPQKMAEHLYQVNGLSSGLFLDRTLSELSNIHLFHFDYQTVEEQEVLRALRSHPSVRAAQYNHYVQERATLPNDPSIGNQWHHVDASDNDIDSDLAWDITTGGTTVNGDDIVVCIIEGGGSNYNHVDLIANHWTNPNEIDNNGVDDDGNGFIDDYNGWNPTNNTDNISAGGHGTAVSGMIGAKGDNNNGGAGVNWDVKLMQVMIGSLNESNVIAAYNYPYVQRNLYNTTGGANGAFVVATNASWGIDNADPSNYPAWCAYYDDLGAVGILNCGATANNNVNIDVVGDMPTGCSSDYMVAVTATNSSDVRTFSGYGATTIDLGAPGESVYLPSGSTGYSSTSGTSFASPCVAGAIAMVYSAPCADLAALALVNPQQAADMVRGYILNGVDPVANLSGECVTGGRLNVRNAIDLALGNCGPLPPCDPVGLTLTADCQYDSQTNTVEASIEVDVTMSEAFCSVETVCYTPTGGALTCDDLSAQGFVLTNANMYFITGLQSNMNYDVYYTTADGMSATVSITTPNCDAEIPGCTDPVAINYDAAATFDDGSCSYPCTDVTLSILTDCWGGEVSWEILDANGNVIASIAGGTYGNQQTNTWTSCLEWGCYTFNIYDSFGDGLAGIASGCAIDGDYDMQDGLGNILFEMGVANYGSGTSHSFCVPVGMPGCTDTAACNYDPAANVDDGSCEYLSCTGCTDAAACNFDPGATIDDSSCDYSCYGCTDPSACNYDGGATIEDGSCEYLTCAGCTDPTACNFDPGATINNGSCDYSCYGCMDIGACNYDPTATLDDGSCEFLSCAGCTDPTACNYDASATLDDGSCEFQSCVCMGDFNDDNEINVADLLSLLAEFGCSSNCVTDMNGDNMVNSSDMLDFLSLFGTSCN